MGKWSLENRLILLIVAGLLGVGGNQILQVSNPGVVRPDPFTGTMGKELEARVREEIKLRLLPHDAHLSKADRGWQLIYEMRQDIAVMKDKITQLARKQNEK